MQQAQTAGSTRQFLFVPSAVDQDIGLPQMRQPWSPHCQLPWDNGNRFAIPFVRTAQSPEEIEAVAQLITLLQS